MANCLATATSNRRPLHRRKPQRRGYSIAAILLLMAAIGVLVGMARALVDQTPTQASQVNAAVGFVGGGLVGGMVGSAHARRFRELLFGVFTGSLTGLVAGAITGLPKVGLPLGLIGSVAIILFAALVRVSSRPRPLPGGDEPTTFAGVQVRRWLADRSTGQWLALALTVLSGVYIAYKLYELGREGVYFGPARMIGQIVMILALAVLTVFLARLAARGAPRLESESSLDLPPHDLTEPSTAQTNSPAEDLTGGA